VALGKEHISRQQQIILDMASAGRDVRLASDVLQTFKNLQATYESEVTWLKAELAKISN
jgi:hypothetical protein